MHHRVTSVTNWSGSTTGGGTGQLFFGSSLSGITSGQLARIQFVYPAGFAPGTYAASILPTGEVVAAAPEPSAVASLIGGVGLLLGIRRRRK